MTVDFSLETREVRRIFSQGKIFYNIFQVLKERVVNPESYLAKILSRNKEEIKIFSNEGKLRVFVTRRPTLREWLEEVF